MKKYLNMKTVVILALLITVLQFLEAESTFQWPQPYERLAKRPVNDKFCQALYPFCPGGYKTGEMPIFDNDDIIEVFAMKAPVWEFRYGNLLGHFNIMHDAIGIRSKKSGVNYTLEWYELDQLLNCTFPHLINNELIWCNQGATCVTPGIDDLHWSQNGTLVKVAEMTANQFAEYSTYVKWDNGTGIFYETWTVHSQKEVNLWFEAHDCSTFVTDSFQIMGKIGVLFNKSVELKYTKMSLVSETPIFLGNISEIMNNPQLYNEVMEFYSLFQPHMTKLKFFEHLLSILYTVMWKKKFYLYYNYKYWYLPMKYPFIQLTYTKIPLP